MFEFITKESGLEIKVKAKRLDATNSDKLRASFEEFCTEPLESIIIDLGDVEFIDSSGIGVLLHIQKQIKSGAKPVKIIDPQAAVLSIIEVLRLQRVFDFQTKKTKEKS